MDAILAQFSLAQQQVRLISIVGCPWLHSIPFIRSLASFNDGLGFVSIAGLTMKTKECGLL
jgi:hypothetical protein